MADEGEADADAFLDVPDAEDIWEGDEDAGSEECDGEVESEQEFGIDAVLKLHSTPFTEQIALLLHAWDRRGPRAAQRCESLTRSLLMLWGAQSGRPRQKIRSLLRPAMEAVQRAVVECAPARHAPELAALLGLDPAQPVPAELVAIDSDGDGLLLAARRLRKFCDSCRRKMT